MIKIDNQLSKFNKSRDILGGIILMVCSSFILAEEPIYLWDFGVKIASQSQKTELVATPTKDNNSNHKFAVLTKRHINPTNVPVELLKSRSKTIFVSENQEFSTLSYLEQYKLGKNYFISGRYVEAIKLLEMVDYSKLSNKQQNHLIYIHTDSMYSLGQFSRVVELLSKNKEFELNDELLLLLGLSSMKIGKDEMALHAFNNILEKFPQSEYQILAKIQTRVLKR